MTHPGSDTGRLIIVSNRLPVSVKRSADGFSYRQSVGGLATGLSAVHGNPNTLWLGWPGVYPRDPRQMAEMERRLIEQYSCQPLFIPTRDFDAFYAGFSNGCLWPLFHYFTQYARYEPKEWRAYEKVNRLFCEKLVEIARPGDRFWIHDYHLLLLPGLLREKLPDAPIGFFLHIPFPSFEILRMMPWRERILEGMLGADLIGFHTFSYARHFLSSLLRLMGLEHEFGRAFVGERPVKVDIFPLGVDVDRFASAAGDAEARNSVADLRAKAKGRKIILSVDRLDFTKGILERLRGFELFLERFGEWHDEVVLILLCVPSRTNVPEYAALKKKVDELVGRVNGRFGKPGWVPIWYLYRSLPLEELLPLYLAADVALVTPLRDGMNLVSKEYLAARTGGDGVLILSETAGSAEELGEAIIVNPHDVEEIGEAISRALVMPEELQRFASGRMMTRLRQYDSRQWAHDFLNQLDAVSRERSLYSQNLLDDERRGELVKTYRNARRRLLLLDYDGALVEFTARAENAGPDPEILNLVQRLVSDDRNTLVLMSGRDHEVLEAWFGGSGADLIAEHGARWRFAAEREWRLSPEMIEEDWFSSIRPVMEVYSNRTPGSYLEEKESSLVWHYRTAEPELGDLRAKELNDTLRLYLMNSPLHVSHGPKYLEVKLSAVTRGQTLRRWLRKRPSPDFILAIGEDMTDEGFFRSLPARAWSIKVGISASVKAQFFVRDHRQVREILAGLVSPAG